MTFAVLVVYFCSDNMKPSRCGKQRRQVAADGSRKMLQCGSVVVKMIEVIESTFRFAIVCYCITYDTC